MTDPEIEQLVEEIHLRTLKLAWELRRKQEKLDSSNSISADRAVEIVGLKTEIENLKVEIACLKGPPY